MKKAFLSLSALVLAIFALAVHLPQSLAELRSSASEAHSSETASARILAGPRKRTVPVQATVTAPAPAQSHLERLFDAANMKPTHRELAAMVLGMLSKDCQEKLQTFSVLYGTPQHRGLAGRGVIIVSGEVPDQEFIGLLLHEGLGHFRDITCLTGNAASGPSAFKDGGEAIWNDDPSVGFYSLSWRNEKLPAQNARREDFVTGYAFEGDNFEDLAESVTYYMTQEDAFRERAAKNPVLAKKLAWLETYMPKTIDFGRGKAWDGQIAWDATKLGYKNIGD